jgi:hypothetical protein
MSVGGWGSSGWGSFVNETLPDAPWGHALSSSTAIVLKERYIRLWLASMPFELNRAFSVGLSQIIDVIEASDYDIGGPVGQ